MPPLPANKPQSTRLTAKEWEAIRIALSFLLAGETDDFENDMVEAAERALDKLLERARQHPSSWPD